jgi:uncharacterized membrane protein YhaH (DUF805 family)
MGPAEAIRTCLAKYFQFSGRAGRAEFWLFAAAVFLIFHFASLVDLYTQLHSALVASESGNRSFASNPVRSLNGFLKVVLPRYDEFLVFPFGYTQVPMTSENYWFSLRSFMGGLGFLQPPGSALPLLAFIFLVTPSLAAIARRSTDAGYRPTIVILALFWPTILVVLNNILHIAMQPEPGSVLARFTQEYLGPVLGYSWPLAKATALYAIYALVSPTEKGRPSVNPLPPR